MITEWYDDREFLLPYLDEMLDQSGSIEDWKREFSATIPEDKFEVYNTAAIFFTGAPLEVPASKYQTLKQMNGDITVYCKGYYEAVDGNDDPISA